MAMQVVGTIFVRPEGMVVSSRALTTAKASSMGTLNAGAASRVAGSGTRDPPSLISIPALREVADTQGTRHCWQKRTLLRLLAAPLGLPSLDLRSTLRLKSSERVLVIAGVVVIAA